MKAEEIFTPFTYPTVTFIDEHLKEKEVLLKRAIQTGGIITTISGPSKSGKTVFVQKTLGKDNVIHVTGPGVLETSTLWNRAFSQVGTPIRQTSSEDSTFQGGFSAKVGVGSNSARRLRAHSKVQPPTPPGAEPCMLNRSTTCNKLLRTLQAHDYFLKKVCVITSVTTDFASVVNKIKEGPEQRGSTRISYRLSDGSTRDVYPIILKALALDPPQLNHRYQQLK